MSTKAPDSILRFKERVGGAGVEVSHGGDASDHKIDGRAPQTVAYPKDIQQLSKLMAAANDCELAVAPRGGGTQTDLGNPPRGLDLVVDMTGLGRVLNHNPADLTATVQAGITVGRLQKVLKKHRQFLAVDPPLPQRATVGGALATGVNGPLKWLYGSSRDTVIGMKVVAADGTVTKSGGQVVKNVSGYDMAKLHIGGLGTLGVIAEVGFKLTPLPAKQATLVAAYRGARKALEAALGVFHSDVVPLALTAFNASANQWAGAVDMEGELLAIRIGGRPRTLERAISECRAICGEHGPSQVELFDEADAGGLWRALADFGWAGDPSPAVLCRASTLPSAVPELVGALEASDDTGILKSAVVSNPAHGGVLIGWAAEAGKASAEQASAAIRTTVDAVRGGGGRVVIERCPPEIKDGLDVWDGVGESVAIMRRLKEQYDPKGVLNPGRFVGGI